MGIIDYLVIFAAYTSGSIPFGLIIYYFMKGDDIRKYGSKNIGATNVLRNSGKIPGISVFVLDVLKGFLPVFIAGIIGISDDTWTITLVAAAAVIGHMFPIWLFFKGGKGVATALGVFLALSWPVALLGLSVFILAVFLTKIVSLSSIMAVISFVLLSLVPGPWTPISTQLQIAAAIVVLLIILKHHENIRRLLSGTEKKITSKKTKGDK